MAHLRSFMGRHLPRSDEMSDEKESPSNDDPECPFLDGNKSSLDTWRNISVKG